MRLFLVSALKASSVIVVSPWPALLLGKYCNGMLVKFFTQQALSPFPLAYH